MTNNSNSAEIILIDVFLRLRRGGFGLGLGELMAALDAAGERRGAVNPEDLRRMLRLLWCKSSLEADQLETTWAAVAARRPPAEPPILPPLRLRPESGSGRSSEPIKAAGFFDQWSSPDEKPMRSSLEALPVLAPYQPVFIEAPDELRAYWPVSRRAMAYAWRYLRRPIPDGPEEILDLEATIERAARDSFFVSPVYRRSERNHAQLIMMIDQEGSMAPFHRFTRDLVETAREESDIERVDVFYFHNVVAKHLYRDPRLTEPVEFEEAIPARSSDISVLLISDAGAARGYRRMERVRATTQFLVQLKRRTHLMAWLNPMPQVRWPGTSAHVIAPLIPMFQMDSDGLINAIDVVRGQSSPDR